MIDYGKLYDEFLYDCYIANQRLTEEDWHYYGKEEHHIEIPNRDEGLLTPLNSQHLTTYQHWVAGVLQSEVLNKVCFAFIPKKVLPPLYEELRIKWQAQHARDLPRVELTSEQWSEVHRKRHSRSTPEHRSEIARKANASRTSEQRSAATTKANANRSPEVVAETVRKMIAARDPENARKGALKRWANTTPEQRAEHARKAAETRRRNKQGG